MAKQDSATNDQQTQSGQQIARGQQQRGVSRPGGFASPFHMSPGEFFRMGPFELLRRFSQDMEHAISDVQGNQQTSARWVPTIEVSEREGKYMVRAELPGVRPDDVALAITGDALIVEGERRDEREQDTGGVHITERRYGRFYRAIPLPEGARTDAAAARFDNGVLEIEIPVEAPKSERRQIPIQSGTQGQTSQTGQTNKQGQPAQSQPGTGTPSKAA